MVLRAGLQLQNQNLISRHEHLLLATSNRTGASRINLFSTRDSVIPVLLASLDLGERVRTTALTDQYLVVVTEERGEMLVYDISNLYAPSLVNRILNPARVEQAGVCQPQRIDAQHRLPARQQLARIYPGHRTRGHVDQR